MNKNKLKYASVPQDSFKFEPPRRQDSHLRPISSINYEARINELCLSAAENESNWVKHKSFYTKTGLITSAIGTALSLLALVTAIYTLFWSDLYQLMQLMPDQLFRHPYIYLLIECLSFFLDLVKIFSFKHIWDILSTKIDSNFLDDGTAIFEAVQKLKIRCIIRHRLKEIQPLFFYLNVFIYSYYAIFVVMVKCSLATYLSVNYKKLIIVGNSSAFCNQTRFDEVERCTEMVHDDLSTFLICFIVFLYVTAIAKLIVQTISFLNFKNVLGFYLIKKLSDNDLSLLTEYQDCKNKVLMNDISKRIEESEAYFSDKFFNLISTNECLPEQEPRYLNDSVENVIKMIDNVNDSNS